MIDKLLARLIRTHIHRRREREKNNGNKNKRQFYH